MNSSVLDPASAAVIEVEARTGTCVVPGCGGAVVRHSLGAGIAVDRCTRCFRRYQVRDRAADGRGRFRRLIDDFINWRE